MDASAARHQFRSVQYVQHPSQTSTIPHTMRRVRMYWTTCLFVTSADEAVGNVKIQQSQWYGMVDGSRGLPCFTKGIYGATGLFLTPFTEGCAGANKKASPPGRRQEKASNNVAVLDPLRSVQISLL